MADGAAGRDLSMNLQSNCSASEVLQDNKKEERLPKTSRRSYGESQRSMGDAIDALERGE